MYKVQFKVKLKEPLILSGSDKTEVTLNCLDYIPGNIFLGIVAGALYDENNSKETLDLFHDGHVQFGNAYLSVDKKQSKPIPATWYKGKGKKLNEGIYFYHKISDKDWKALAKDGNQIKQERIGYFVEQDGKMRILNARKGVVLKSAYNSTRRSAKKEKMYLYEYLEAGQEFIFEIKAINNDYLDKISKVLPGKRDLSKSKTSEFGSVTIERIDDTIIEEGKTNPDKNKELYIVYALSNLAFINEFGEYTWTVTPECLGFENAKINFEKSQLYFDKLHTRNGKRRTHDSDRLIVKKGSVFIIEKKNNSEIVIDNERITNGVGVFLSEGYGNIMVNPSFIDGFDKDRVVYYGENRLQNEIKNDAELNSLNKILEERYKFEESLSELYKEVSEFINKRENRKTFRDITSSQWGAIRSYVYQSRMSSNPNQELYKIIFDNQKGYIYHGQMGKKWIGNKRYFLKQFLELVKKDDEENKKEILEISDKNIEKLLLLSIEFPKQISYR